MTTITEQRDGVGLKVNFVMLDIYNFTVVAVPTEDLYRTDEGDVVLDAEGLPMINPRKDVERYYVAGPMTGYDKWNFPAFDAARNKLLARGIQVISPADLDRLRGVNEDTPPEDFPPDAFVTAMKIDAYASLQCTGMFFLKGWENSTGARNEMSWCQAWGLKKVFDNDANRGSVQISAVCDV